MGAVGGCGGGGGGQEGGGGFKEGWTLLCADLSQAQVGLEWLAVQERVHCVAV